jgi:hypothetical protein
MGVESNVAMDSSVLSDRGTRLLVLGDRVRTREGVDCGGAETGR